jgi:hypothetical protein
MMKDEEEAVIKYKIIPETIKKNEHMCVTASIKPVEISSGVCFGF